MEYESTADTMRERADKSGIRLWLLLGADRRLITGLFMVFVFASYLVVGVLYGPSLSSAIGSNSTLDTMVSTLIGGIITGTTLVVTISQLVISQELGPLGDQYDRLHDAMAFRDETEAVVEPPFPPIRPCFWR